MDQRETHPDPAASGNPQGLRSGNASGEGDPPSPPREAQEREAGRRRARERRRASGGDRDPDVGRADPQLVEQAFAALAENVRDYAIFLMDRDGVIRFWGEGARILKRWTRDEAEGSHLRMLYPNGGSEDGTAEDHLRSAAEEGEYVGEGPRVRGDGTTFWARVTLTALKDSGGALIGFTKVTVDLTEQRVADAARALVGRDSERTGWRAARGDMQAEVDVLREEVAVLRRELERRDLPQED